MGTVNKRIVILMIAYILEHYDKLRDKSVEDIYQQSYKYVNSYVKNSKFKQVFDDIIEKYNCKKYANRYQEYMDTEDLTDMKFRRLTVISRAPDKINKNKRIPMWNCLCDCGNSCVVSGYLLQSGKTQSCGCIRKEVSREMMKKYNTFDLSGDIGIGYTIKGEEFYFDLEDYDKIKDICWSIDAYGYVSSGGRKYKMHRYILEVTDLQQTVDHINHIRNDNRKSNLRICTHAENMKNLNPERNKYGVVGISWNKKDKKWVVQLTCNGVHHYIGSFIDFDEAAQARYVAEDKYFGEFAYKNSEVNLPEKKGESL